MSSRVAFRFEPAPSLPGSDRLGRPIMGVARLAAHRLWDFTVEGLENVPTTGPAIIAPNHLSFCDSVFVPSALPRRTWAIGKAEYMDSWKTRYLFPAMGMIPVDREGGQKAMAALDGAAEVLDAGHLFMIYPEGTRSRSEFLHKGRTGAARLAARCGAPIIPTGHEGTLAVQPPDSPMMKTGLPVTVRFGEPMHPDDFGSQGDPRALRRFTDAVMFEIAALSGQTYVDQYASGDDTPGQLAVPATPTTTVPPNRDAVERPRISLPPGRAAKAPQQKIAQPPGRRARSNGTDPAPREHQLLDLG